MNASAGANPGWKQHCWFVVTSVRGLTVKLHNNNGCPMWRSSFTSIPCMLTMQRAKSSELFRQQKGLLYGTPRRYCNSRSSRWKMFLDAWMKQGVTDEVRKRSWSTEELNQLWYVAQASTDKVSLTLGSERDMFVLHLSPHTCGSSRPHHLFCTS